MAMTRKLLPILIIFALLAPLASVPSQAQDAEASRIELHITASSRGYVRPLRATAERLSRIDGLSDVRMLGFAGDTMRFEVTTALTPGQIAAGTRGELISHRDGVVTLAPVKSMRAQRAEARSVIMRIALELLKLPKPTWGKETAAYFTGADTTAQRLTRLGLNPRIAEGHFYKLRDYKIVEEWTGTEGTYRIFVGNEWREIYVPNDDYWGPTRGDDAEEPDPDSAYVGARVYRSTWNNSFNWADPEGLSMSGDAGKRSDTDGNGELYVRQGADWMLEILQAAAAYRVRNPDTNRAGLPAGEGWTLLARLDEQGNLDRWGRGYYSSQSFRMEWEDRDGRLIANLKAHHESHPFYLEAELDSEVVLEDYRQRAEDEGADFSELQRAELGEAVTWIVEAEEGVEVFQRRRVQAGEVMEKIAASLKVASNDHELDALCGRLDDVELAERLGVTVDTDSEFTPGDFVIRRQMFGDVEISVGDARTGGRYWTLVNAAGGEVIRSVK